LAITTHTRFLDDWPSRSQANPNATDRLNQAPLHGAARRVCGTQGGLNDDGTTGNA